MNEKGLKCCPFCGEVEDIVVRTRVENKLPLRGERYSFVECLPCDAKTGRYYDSDTHLEGFESSKEQAIFYWNLREGCKCDCHDS